MSASPLSVCLAGNIAEAKRQASACLMLRRAGWPNHATMQTMHPCTHAPMHPCTDRCGNASLPLPLNCSSSLMVSRCRSALSVKSAGKNSIKAQCGVAAAKWAVAAMPMPVFQQCGTWGEQERRKRMEKRKMGCQERRESVKASGIAWQRTCTCTCMRAHA